MRFNAVKGLSLLVLSLLTPIAYSGVVSPYLPVNVSPLLENEIERLASVSGMSTLSKPYSLARIMQHLETVKESHPRLFHRLNKALTPYTRSSSLTHLSLAASYSKDNHTLANQRGNYTASQLNVSFRSQIKVQDWLGFFIGGEVIKYRDSELGSEKQLTGSMLAIGTDWAQIDIGYKDIWLSPFKGSAQLLSTHAQTMPSISVSNNRQLETFGIHWNYNVFLAQMSRQQVQFKPGEFSDKDKPLLAGMHVNFQLTDWLSIGASRVFQFAGGERPLSAKTLLKAFFDPRGADNDASVEQESGNQIAAISSKIDFDGSIPFSFSVELAGEDTSNNKAYQLGNTALTAGLYFPYLFDDNASLTYEYSSWQTAWYENNVYQDGYVNEGFVLGHWAMQPQRELKTATPGNSHFLQVHWQLYNDDIISSTLRTSQLESTNTINYKDSWELELDYATAWKSHIISAGIHLGESSLGDKFTQLNFAWEL